MNLEEANLQGIFPTLIVHFPEIDLCDNTDRQKSTFYFFS